MDGRSMRGALASGALAVLVLAACTSGEAEPEPLPLPSPTASPAPAEPTASPTDPYAVPDEITPEYVERVYAALAEIEAEAIRELMRAYEADRGLSRAPSAFAQALAAIYTSDEGLVQMTSWEQQLGQDDPFADMRPRGQIGPAVLLVAEVIEGDAECILVRARHDYSAQVPDSLEPGFSWLLLTPAPAGARDLGNPTPWVIARDRAQRPGEPVPELSCP